MNVDWRKIDNNCISFISKFDDEVIHIIKTGFDNLYIVVFEDAYQMELGKILLCTKEEIYEKFCIYIGGYYKESDKISSINADHPLNADCPVCGHNGYNCRC